jgi:hypothetical protein
MLDNLASILVKTCSAVHVVSIVNFPGLLCFLLLGRVGEPDVENVIILQR